MTEQSNAEPAVPGPPIPFRVLMKAARAFNDISLVAKDKACILILARAIMSEQPNAIPLAKMSDINAPAETATEKAERIWRGKKLRKLRSAFINIRDGLEDEGDRVYFGSTNDADVFRAEVQALDDFDWSVILKEKGEPDYIASLAASRKRCRALKAEADAAFANGMRRAAHIAREACLVEPDGGSPTEAEAKLCDEIADRILALLPLTAA